MVGAERLSGQRGVGGGGGGRGRGRGGSVGAGAGGGGRGSAAPLPRPSPPAFAVLPPVLVPPGDPPALPVALVVEARDRDGGSPSRQGDGELPQEGELLREVDGVAVREQDHSPLQPLRRVWAGRRRGQRLRGSRDQGGGYLPPAAVPRQQRGLCKRARGEPRLAGRGDVELPAPVRLALYRVRGGERRVEGERGGDPVDPGRGRPHAEQGSGGRGGRGGGGGRRRRRHRAWRKCLDACSSLEFFSVSSNLDWSCQKGVTLSRGALWPRTERRTPLGKKEKEKKKKRWGK